MSGTTSAYEYSSMVWVKQTRSGRTTVRRLSQDNLSTLPTFKNLSRLFGFQRANSSRQERVNEQLVCTAANDTAYQRGNHGNPPVVVG